MSVVTKKGHDMKKLKQMMMLGISCMLTLSMSLAASAASIKVSNSQEDAVYNAYKIFDAAYASDGKAAYTLSTASADGQAIYEAFQTNATADGETIKTPFTFSSSGTAGNEVLEGLEPGERVVTSGYEAFKDNEVLVLK